MAKTSYQLIPSEFNLSYSKALQSGDRFTFPRVRRKTLFISKNRKKGVTQKSLIPILSPVWQALTQGERDAWNSAGVVANMTGFKLFVRDKSLRIANNIEGYAIPNDFYQTTVGTLIVSEPATSLKILQTHPEEYWVQRKVKGTRSQYEPIKIIEDFALPLEIKINYSADLTPIQTSDDSAECGIAVCGVILLGTFGFSDENAECGFAECGVVILGTFDDSPIARFYCIIYSHYQGLTFENIVEIPFILQQDWTHAEATLPPIIGKDRGYTAFLEIKNARGTVWFDNIEILHSGQNWCRDPHTLDLDQSFTKAFYQIPKHWAPVDISEGAFFGSLYYNV